jgi:pyridoxal phosphate enzyme (YggS family)
MSCPALSPNAALASFARDKAFDMSIPENLTVILARIAAARKAAFHPAPDTRLVAVSKTVDENGIRQALAAGQRLFGENRVQEAEAKFPQLKRDYPELELHLIGPLQTNKVKEAMALFDCIQTLDRIRLADALAAARDKSGTCPELFVQVNTGEEEQKAGVLPAQTAALIARARKLDLPVTGLMCIPPASQEAAPHFGFLVKLARDNGLDQLSMGMSGDFEMAIRFGATHVRVGTAIFGARDLTQS